MDQFADQLRAELQGQYAALTERIGALDRDLARCTEAEQKLVLQDRRSELAAERRNVITQLTALENGVEQPISPIRVTKAKRMDNDDLTRIVYEIRADVTILKEQFAAFREHRETAGIPSHILLILMGLGILTLVVLSYMTVRIGL